MAQSAFTALSTSRTHHLACHSQTTPCPLTTVFVIVTVPFEVAATTTATMTFSKGGCVVEITQEENYSLTRMPEFENWAKDMYTFICDNYGEENIIGFYAHLDETSPHLHCTIMPIKDGKFAEKLHDYILFKDLDNKYMTLKDCIEQNKKEETEETAEAKDTETEKTDEDKEPEKTTIFYVTDPVQQSQYINMFKEAGKNAVILSHNIDTAFISHLEQKDQTIQFKRIDADLTEELKGDGAADEETAKTLTELFRKSLNKDKLEVKVENLKNESVAAMMTLSEESRRMQDMMKMYNMYGMDPSMFGGQETLVLNANHPLVQFLGKNQESEHAAVICEQLYDLAMLSHKQLSPDEMTKFVKRSNEILMMIAK